MLFPTHILLGIVFFLLFKGFLAGNEIILLLLVLLGSLLPDLDSPHSKVSQWSGIVGKIVSFFFRHRGILHSIVLHLLLFVIISYVFNVFYARALFIGYLAHVLGDGITPAGVKLFYPFSKFKLKGPVKVGGIFEWVLLVLLIIVVLKEVLL